MAVNSRLNKTGNIRSIWDNDFYNTPPALAWTFKINFSDFVGFNILNDAHYPVKYITNGDMDILSKAAVSISVGERKIESTDLFYGGLSFKKLTRVDNGGQFPVRFNENSGYDVTNILEKLYSVFGNSKKYFFDNNEETPVPYAREMISDDTITEINEQDDRNYVNLRHGIISVQIFDPQITLNNNEPESCYKQYKFYNCQYIGTEGIEFSYESTDTITRNATFIYDWMEYNVMYDNRNANYLAPTGGE